MLTRRRDLSANVGCKKALPDAEGCCCAEGRVTVLGVRAQIRKWGQAVVAEGPSALACGWQWSENCGERESDLSASTSQVPRAEASSRMPPIGRWDKGAREGAP